MNATQLLDLPATEPSLLHATRAESMTFLQRGQTREQLIRALANVAYQPLPDRIRSWIIASTVEITLTFTFCAVMVIRKRGFGNLWIFTRRQSAYGSVYVANAVLVLFVGIAAYLFSFWILGIVIASFSFVEVSTLEWWWVIPLPWFPLVAGAYISVHGFVLGCSPRSPLSLHHNSNTPGVQLRWFHFRVPRSPWIVNSALVLPLVLFSATTFILVGFSGSHYYRAKRLTQELLPDHIYTTLATAALGPHVFLGAQDSLATDELIWQARVVAAAYLESHRYVCINLVVFATCAMALWIPYLCYGWPNLVSLVDHAFSHCPGQLPSGCTTYPRKLWYLLTKGKPTSETSSAVHNLGTWKMTLLAHMYVLLVLVCVPAYGWLPMYIVGSSYPHRVQAGEISPSIQVALYSVSVVTILSCVFIVIFSTVASLDPVFRAVIGLNMIRNKQMPIDITVVQLEARHEDNEPASPVASDKPHLHDWLETRDDQPRSLALKPSTSTLQSPQASFTTDDSLAYPLSRGIHISEDDIHISNHPYSSSSP